MTSPRRTRACAVAAIVCMCLAGDALAGEYYTEAEHLLLLGGGGYELKSTTQAWCRMWAAANRIDSLPDFMLSMGGTLLGGEDIAGADIVDMTYRVSGEKKAAIMKELERVATYHENVTFPAMMRTLGAKSEPGGK